MANDLSYAQGSHTLSILHDTFADYLNHTAVVNGQSEALVSCHQRLRYTYRELHSQVQLAARALMALDVMVGDRIGIWSVNCAEWLIIQYASATIGAILVQINPAYGVHEMAFALSHAGVAILVVGRDPFNSDCRTVLSRLELHPSSSGQPTDTTRFPHLRSIVYLERQQDLEFSWDDLMKRHRETPESVLEERKTFVHGHLPASIVYSSGTTGRPKGAVHSQVALLRCGAIISHRLAYGIADRICLPVPFYHVFGSSLGSMSALVSGSAIVLPGDSFDTRQCLDAIASERCTALYGVPSMFGELLRHPTLDHYDLQSLRTGIIAGAPCSWNTMEQIIHKLKIPQLTVSYGMTECLAALHSVLDNGLERRVSTVGTVLPFVECKIIDPASGSTLPRGSNGEICIRGYGVMLAYWEDVVATASLIDMEGWVHTGDIGMMSSDGYVSVVGRLKNVIIRCGENIYPREIEDILQAHPKVREVHVVGLPDPDHGEQVCACIRLLDGETATASEIRRYCRGHIATYKVPRYIVFVDGFPLTATGKIQTFRLREIMLSELGNVLE